MVNRAVEQMVCDAYGDATWQDIKSRAGVTTISFLSSDPYPDEITYDLVGAASEVLEIPADQILRSFGEYWVLNTASDAYPDLMSAAGDDLPTFLGNLNNLHVRVGMIFPELQPPRFTVTDVGEDHLVLHHHTRREGLAPFVEGLVIGLGQRFGTPARVTLRDSRSAGADHDSFDVTWTAVGE